MVISFAILAAPLGAAAQNLTVLKSLGGTDGYTPYGTLVLSSNVLYGTTQSGGASGKGTVFRINTDGSSFTLLKSFDSAGPGSPMGKLVLSGNTLYGTTLTDATDSTSRGAIFRINTDGTGYTVLKHFALSDGAGPHGGLVLSGNVLYGTTYIGGVWDLGVVFKINTNGTGFQVLREFTPYDGANPAGDLLLAGNILYGTTYGSGGTNGLGGTVFKMKTDGTGFGVLKSFAYADGNHPYAGLALSNGVLYGAAYSGGSYGLGTIFKLNTNGTGYAVLHAFAATNGSSPYATLALSGNTLYGTTYDGGSPLATTVGTVFQINTDGSAFTVLKNLGAADGTHPYAGVAVSGNTLYGATCNGGSKYFGTIFSLAPGLPFPSIVIQPRGRTNALGTVATFDVTATPTSGIAYQWRRNGANLANSAFVSGATSNALTIANVQLTNAGDFSVVVSNSSGSVTSTVAVLVVKAPPIANADLLEVPLGLAASVSANTLLVNDRDPNGEPIALAAVQSPSSAGVNLSFANGLITYWGAFSGPSDRFTYTLTNASGLSATGTVNVILTGSLPATNHISMQPLSDGAFRLAFLGITTFRYALDLSHDLTHWQPLQTNWTGARGYVFFTNAPPRETNLFYRTRWVPGI